MNNSIKIILFQRFAWKYTINNELLSISGCYNKDNFIYHGSFNNQLESCDSILDSESKSFCHLIFQINSSSSRENTRWKHRKQRKWTEDNSIIEYEFDSNIDMSGILITFFIIDVIFQGPRHFIRLLLLTQPEGASDNCWNIWWVDSIEKAADFLRIF